MVRCDFNFTVWYGESEETARFIAKHTLLRELKPSFRQMYTSGESFAENPELIKQILYLDRPDVIVTGGYPESPIVGVEVSAEAMTGHDVFQRFGRIVAAAEHGTPFAYIFPRKKWVRRAGSERWDFCNPLIFLALLRVTRFHDVPALAFDWQADEEHGNPHRGKLLCAATDADLPHPESIETKRMFNFIDAAIEHYLQNRPYIEMINSPLFADRERLMWQWFHERGGNTREWSPLTSCEQIPTKDLPNYIKTHSSVNNLKLPPHIKARDNTLIYKSQSAQFRGDPYAGSLIALDYLGCRNGPTPQHRHTNLALHFPRLSINEVVDKAQRYHANNCALRYDQKQASGNRYYSLHLRDGCRYTKQKEIRMFCAFADLIIFSDGVLI